MKLRVFVLMLAFFFVAAAPMCETMPADDPGTVQSVMTEANVLVGEAQAEVSRLRAVEAAGDLTPAEAGKLAEAEANLNDLATSLAAMQARADSAGRPVDAGDVVGGLAPLLGPVGIPISIVTTAFAQWWRTRKKRESFTRLVTAIDKVKASNPALASAFGQAGPQINAEMGPTAVAVIKKIRTNGG